jgi:predicted  nucleic acid-binding Zn-ribbon protein
MYDQLPILLQLQEIDDEIDKLGSRKARIPVELRALDAELAEYRQAFQVQTDALEELQKQRRSKDRQLSVQQAQLEKYKSQRLSVKTNKEYDALESEIADLEEANSAIEDEILELMISIDEATDEIEVAGNELKAQEDLLKKKRDESLSEVKKLDQQIAQWNKKRGGFLGKVDPALMNKYDNWRKRSGSSLVAVIEGQSCGGCHLKLPPQLINEVRKKKELHTCNSCGRILYWEDEE